MDCNFIGAPGPPVGVLVDATPPPTALAEGDTAPAGTEVGGEAGASNRRDDAPLQLGIEGAIDSQDGQPNLEAGLSGRTESFLAGYRAGGGDPAWEEHLVNDVIPCESEWNPYAVSPGGHLGLLQFTARSWRLAGGGDWASPYQQGLNAAVWMSITVPSQQWACW